MPAPEAHPKFKNIIFYSPVLKMKWPKSEKWGGGGWPWPLASLTPPS